MKKETALVRGTRTGYVARVAEYCASLYVYFSSLSLPRMNPEDLLDSGHIR